MEFSLFLAKNEKKQIPGEHHVRNDKLRIPQLLSRIELAMSYDDNKRPASESGPYKCNTGAGVTLRGSGQEASAT
jgi:hypothetical protein